MNSEQIKLKAQTAAMCIAGDLDTRFGLREEWRVLTREQQAKIIASWSDFIEKVFRRPAGKKEASRKGAKPQRRGGRI